MVRGALAALLELEPDIEVVAQARDGAEALSFVETLRPDDRPRAPLRGCP